MLHTTPMPSWEFDHHRFGEELATLRNFFFFLMELEFELRASCFLDRVSST
jgi:hypothetical protein